MKMCTKCKEMKPETEFWKNKSKREGITSRCKVCSRVDEKIGKQKPSVRAKRLAYENVRSKTPHRQLQAKAYLARRRVTHPEIIKARAVISNGIRDGKVVRKPCEKCGEVKSQAHHPDYSKPIDVVWLCGDHHRKLHQALREAIR